MTFAVTGCCDDEFIGQHFESGAYGLELTLNAGFLIGDHNGDRTVDALDYVVWRMTETPPDGYEEWRSHFGSPPNGSGLTAGMPDALAAVPEPSGLMLVLFAACGWFVLARLRLER